MYWQLLNNMSEKLILNNESLMKRIGIERQRSLGFDKNPSVDHVLDRTREAALIVIDACFRNGMIGNWDISRVEDRLHDMRNEVVDSLKIKATRIERE